MWRREDFIEQRYGKERLGELLLHFARWESPCVEKCVENWALLLRGRRVTEEWDLCEISLSFLSGGAPH